MQAPSLSLAEQDTDEGKAKLVVYKKQLAMGHTHYDRFFPVGEDHKTWQQAEAALKTKFVDDVCILRGISFCEVPISSLCVHVQIFYRDVSFCVGSQVGL